MSRGHEHVWPCAVCTVFERALPSDFGKTTNGYTRIIAHERKHAGKPLPHEPQR